MSADSTAMGTVTAVLRRFRESPRACQSELIPLVYDELRRIAVGLSSRERREHTLQATALVHEAYLQIFGERNVQIAGVDWRDRRHFLGIAARLMRRILVDHARERNASARTSSPRCSISAPATSSWEPWR